MSDEKHRRPIRQQFNAFVRLAVEGSEEVKRHYADNISSGGLFIRSDIPEPVGSLVLIELGLPDGQPLCVVSGTVRHSRPATVPGEKQAGMGIEIQGMDARARKLIACFEQERSEGGLPKREIIAPASPRTPPPIKHEGPVVGIDLGTSNSCVGYVVDGRPCVLTSPRGYQSLPSILFVDERQAVDLDFDLRFDDEPKQPEEAETKASTVPDLDGLNYQVGHQAQEQMILSPHRAIYGSKRFLGRPFASNEVQTLGHFFTYEVVEGPQGQAAARIDDHVISLESVAACVLMMLKEMAEQHLSEPVSRAVITVPAHFGETQRAAVHEAAHRAGLYVERLINEPTSVALGYCFDQRIEQTVLVYDLGGGTFDTSVLRIHDEGIEVLASDGDPFLGGSDFDDRMTEFVLMTVEKQLFPEVRQNPVAVQRVRFSVELAKKHLSQATKTQLSIPHIGKVDQGPVHIDMALDRTLFERLTVDLVERTLVIVEQVLTQSGVTGDEIDRVIVVGGQSRSPMVHRLLLERFGKKLSQRVHPDEAVALGAAVLAYRKQTGSMPQLNDILAATIGIRTRGDSIHVLFERGTRLPAEIKVDVAHLEDAGKMLTLYRGEGASASANTLLGLVPLPKVEIDETQMMEFKLSADGILSVGAHDPITGKYHDAQVQLRGLA